MVEPGVVIGAVGLGLRITDDTISLIRFIHDVVVDTRHYGDQVTSVRTRMASEIARLQELSSFLRRTTATGASRFSTLRPASRSAVLGLLQELEIAVAAYTVYVNKHNVDALRQGYTKSVEGGLDGPLLESRLGEGVAVAETAGRAQKLGWGIFKKTKIMKLLTTLEEWNDRTLKLLLCVISFDTGNDDGGDEPDNSTAPSSQLNKYDKKLIISQGLSFKAMMEDGRAGNEALKQIMEPTHAITDIDISHRMATLISQKPSPTSRRVFIEVKPYELRRRATEPSDEVKARVARLARLLSHPLARDAGMSALRCVAVTRSTPIPRAYVFAFELPADSFSPEANAPMTLLDAVSSKTVIRPTLDERFAMARCLTSTIFHLHSVTWVHKSVRCENILLGELVGEDGSRHYDFTHPLLVGFEFSRDAKDRSTTEQDGRLERNVYRHPDRQGPPEGRFNELHDLYALGVVLLEIGLWWPVIGFENWEDKEPEEVKNALIRHASERLPHYMGTEYTEAVVACLRGDLMESEAGLEFTDEKRLELNLRLFERVLGRIGWGVKR